MNQDDRIRVQQIDAELAVLYAKKAELEKAKKIAKKPPKPVKSDAKLKKRIIDYQKDAKMVLIAWYLESDATKEGFYEHFRDYPISEKLAILECSIHFNNPQKMAEILNYDPECESE